MYDSANTFSNVIRVALDTGPYNDLGIPTQKVGGGGSIMPTFRSGSTNRFLFTAASGGSTINSLDASGYSEGETVFMQNLSSTDYLIFTHLGGGTTANQFSNANAGEVAIPPLGAARCTRSNGMWQFA